IADTHGSTDGAGNRADGSDVARDTSEFAPSRHKHSAAGVEWSRTERDERRSCGRAGLSLFLSVRLECFLGRVGSKSCPVGWGRKRPPVSRGGGGFFIPWWQTIFE